MDLFTGIASYIIIWWVVLFAVLPLGVRSQLEDDEVQPGSEPGAPIAPNLLKKALITSIAAFGFWLVLFVIIHVELIKLR